MTDSNQPDPESLTARVGRLHPEGAPGLVEALARVFNGDRAYEENVERARVEAEAVTAHRRRMEKLAEDEAKARAGRDTFAQLVMLAAALLLLAAAVRVLVWGW